MSNACWLQFDKCQDLLRFFDISDSELRVFGEEKQLEDVTFHSQVLPEASCLNLQTAKNFCLQNVSEKKKEEAENVSSQETRIY